MPTTLAAAVLALLASAAMRQAADPAPPISAADQILATSPANDWRDIDPRNTLYLDLPAGRVLIELAPTFAPHHVANIERLVRQGYFDGLAIVRAQDNYVVQWADPDAKRSLGGAEPKLQPEFTRGLDPATPFTPLPDVDTYAPRVGFADGFPVARDPAAGQAWLTHCYGMVGAGRDNAADSGNGAELYAVIGNAPRLLDRNVTLVGRVVQGMDILSVMPRGKGALGFYQTPAERTQIRSVKIAADLPPGERVRLQALRTDSPTFAALVQGRRFRHDDWYKTPAGHVDICNVPLPVRMAK